jgi:hypothetical protein
MLRQAAWQGAGRRVANTNRRLAPGTSTTLAICTKSLRFNLRPQLYSSPSRLIEEFDSATSGPISSASTTGQAAGLFNVPGLVSPSSWGRLVRRVEDEVERLVAHVRQRTADNRRHAHMNTTPTTHLRIHIIRRTASHTSFLIHGKQEPFAGDQGGSGADSRSHIGHHLQRRRPC